jgi:hypothetical protein
MCRRREDRFFVLCPPNFDADRRGLMERKERRHRALDYAAFCALWGRD